MNLNRSNRIGIGIITCNRKHFFEKLINSIPEVDEVVVVNDGKPYDNSTYPNKISEIIQHKNNKGISKTKNDALRFLMNHNCDHLFLLEDDIALNDQAIIEKYIKASRVSGILHFNYAYHGFLNRGKNGEPNPRKIVVYPEDVKITLHKNVTGALSYYRRDVIAKVGLMDEKYKNVIEHVDHTFQIIKHGFHPPFRWFADIEESYSMVLELDINLKESMNAKSILPLNLRTRIFEEYFKLKNGCRIWEIPDTDEDKVMVILEKIKTKYT
jgi:GT2 family glycosyltransferase